LADFLADFLAAGFAFFGTDFHLDSVLGLRLRKRNQKKNFWPVFCKTKMDLARIFRRDFSLGAPSRSTLVIISNQFFHPDMKSKPPRKKIRNELHQNLHVASHH
jgi:hypothetical protein